MNYKKVNIKKVSLLLFISIVFFCCNQRARESQSANKVIDSKTDEAYFSDESKSNFYILSKVETKGYEYQSVETNYKVVFIIPDGYKKLEHYIAKYTTTTKTCTACEKADRNIKVEIFSIEKPSKLVMEIDKNCDKLDLFAQTYKTTVYGCCGSENSYEIFDYQQNSIIQADNQIIVGNFSHPQNEFYIGFKIDNDTIRIGSFNYSYNSQEKYAINILTSRNIKKDFLSFAPVIEILGDGHNFSKSNNEYNTFRLNRISDKNSINMSIKLTFPCENEAVDNVIEIPIINGKPLGKEDTIQKIYIAEIKE